MAFFTNFATEFFHTVFARRSVLKGTLRRDQKVIFVKSPISSPSYSDALKVPETLLICRYELLEIEKGIVREVALGGQTPSEKIFRSKSTNQEGLRSAYRTDLCFSTESEDFLRWRLSPERNLAHNFFLRCTFLERKSAKLIVIFQRY